MTTADRIDPVGYSGWASPAATPTDVDDEDYVGRHRRHGGRSLSLHRMFYTPRHRRKI